MILPLLALLQQPDLDVKIDFTPPINVLSKTLVQLEKATGAKLTATPALGREVVAVIAKQQSGQEIMDRLAHVLHAEWQKTGKEYTLSRSEKTQKELYQTHIQARADDYQKRLNALAVPKLTESDMVTLGSQAKALVGAVATGGGFTPEWDQLVNKTPAYAYAIELIRSIPTNELAAIPDRKRIVYSSDPSKVQRQLPSAWRQGFAAFRAKDNRLPPISLAKTAIAHHRRDEIGVEI